MEYPIEIISNGNAINNWTNPINLISDCNDFSSCANKLELYDDDVWLVTYPKSGTTWMLELLWLVLNGYDFETAKLIDLDLRAPFFEFDSYLYDDWGQVFERVQNLTRPRLFKTHLTLSKLPSEVWSKSKVVYVARNPKDIFVSYYHHVVQLGQTKGLSLDEYIEKCMSDGRIKKFFKQTTDFYHLRYEPWLFYTSFERMKLNLSNVIEDVCTFLNRTITEDTMNQMLKHLSFEEMKRNPTTNHRWEFETLQKHGLRTIQETTQFIRKGEVNNHKKELAPHTLARLNYYVDGQLYENNISMDELLLLTEINDYQ